MHARRGRGGERLRHASKTAARLGPGAWRWPHLDGSDVRHRVLELLLGRVEEGRVAKLGWIAREHERRARVAPRPARGERLWQPLVPRAATLARVALLALLLERLHLLTALLLSLIHISEPTRRS
eukprot:6708323-Prymnesium_polylepis.1